AHDRAGALRGVDDLGRRLIDQPIVERLQSDPDLLVLHGGFLKSGAASGCGRRGLRCGPRRTDRRWTVRGRVQVRILATTPAPTVLPPSRIAKRRPCSIAIGAIS